MKHHLRFNRLTWLLVAGLLAACSQVPEPVPMQTLEALNGKWQQVNGQAIVHFYKDEDVKFLRPDRHPPLRVLTTLETMKDGMGFSIGDRWTQPVRVKLAQDGQSLTLTLPGEPEEKLIFKRSQ